MKRAFSYSRHSTEILLAQAEILTPAAQLDHKAGWKRHNENSRYFNVLQCVFATKPELCDAIA